MVVQEAYRVAFENAHKEIQAFYNNPKNQGIDFIPTAEQNVHAIFNQKNVDGENTHVQINQIHRVRKGGFKNNDEYIYFLETHKGHDHRGNEIEKFVVNGKYRLPIGEYKYDEFTGDTKCVGISRHETKYPINFTTKLLDDLVDEGKINESTVYSVEMINGREYSIQQYEDYRNMSFDDLIHLGMTGNRPETKEPEGKPKKAN